MTSEEKNEHEHKGITTRIRERLDKAKNETREKNVHESLPGHVKEKIHERYENYQAERHEKKQHQQTLKKTQKEAYQKEEIHQASERGKQAAKNRYTPQKHSTTKNASNFVAGATRSSEKFIFGSGSSSSVYGGLSLFPSATKKKPAPQRVTRVSKNGTVTITEPVQDQKKKFIEKEKPWSPLDTINMDTIHTPHGSNPFDIDIIKPHAPSHKGKKSKGKRERPNNWHIGDLI